MRIKIWTLCFQLNIKYPTNPNKYKICIRHGLNQDSGPPVATTFDR